MASSDSPDNQYQVEDTEQQKATSPNVLGTPGPLRGDSWIELQTREAQYLLKGRRATKEHPQIIGLTLFGAQVSSLYFAARFDDPYVDSWLIELEDTLDQVERLLRRQQDELQANIQERPHIHIGLGLSINPIKIPLKFNNPYSYRAAELIGLFDELMRSILTSRHTGLIDRGQAERLKQESSRLIRRALASASRYPRGLIASREDLRQGTAKAKAALEKYGELPEGVVSGDKRGRFAPDILSVDDERVKGGIFEFDDPAL